MVFHRNTPLLAKTFVYVFWIVAPVTVLWVGSAVGQGSSPGATSDPDGFASDKERYSYAVGMDVGGRFRHDQVGAIPEMVYEGMLAAYADEGLRLSQEQADAAMEIYYQLVSDKDRELDEAAAKENRAQGEAFLKNNAARSGVETTASGLQIEILRRGDGPTPEADQVVRMHVLGTLINGTPFEVPDPDHPIELAVDGVVPGFAEGLRRLPVGSKAKLFVPADLAYGDDPDGPGGAGSAVVFEVDVLGVEEPPPPVTMEDQIADALAQMEEDIASIKRQTEEWIEKIKAMELPTEAELRSEASGSVPAVSGEDP